MESQATSQGDHSPTCTGFEKDLCSITKVLANYGPNLACGHANNGLYVFEGLKTTTTTKTNLKRQGIHDRDCMRPAKPKILALRPFTESMLANPTIWEDSGSLGRVSQAS